MTPAVAAVLNSEGGSGGDKLSLLGDGSSILVSSIQFRRPSAQNDRKVVDMHG